MVQLFIDALDFDENILANVLNLVSNTLHVVADILYVITDNLDLPLDTLDSIIHPHYFALDALSHLQLLRRCHPCLFLREFVQPLQAILDVSVPRQLPQEPF